MNEDNQKRAISSSSLSSALMQKLNKLSKKLSSLGYSQRDINEIIVTTFLDIPFGIDWLDLQNTNMMYSLKDKMKFDTKDTQVIMTLSKCFLVKPIQNQNTSKILMNKLQLSCNLFGFDLENEESGSSQQNSTFLQVYQSKIKKQQKSNKLQKCIEKLPQRFNNKLNSPQIQKKKISEPVKPRKKAPKRKQQQPLVQPKVQKKPKFE